MFNAQQPSIDDLPTTKQLVRSTVIALIAATAILFLIVLPAEYGLDPTGVGEFLGLKSMGEIKVSLEEESLEEVDVDNSLSEVTDKNLSDTTTIPKNDVIECTIAPGEAIEIKMEMQEGTIIQYSWSAVNGKLNFNAHGDGYKGTKMSTTYNKGRMIAADSGELLAAFNGYHGWFWRNRNDNPVTLRLETWGNYLQIKQVL
ncbi:MAG: transmembrane anchor protein [Candidatus Marinimicrobia bacterium]|nr:transmembrane anchor protein [Candidatus Neomarinimicrobiota bacterium]